MKSHLTIGKFLPFFKYALDERDLSGVSTVHQVPHHDCPFTYIRQNGI